MAMLLLFSLGALGGCKFFGGTTQGQKGVLGFYEPNDYPGDSVSSAAGFDRPLALGARADLWVLASGISALQSVETDDPNVVRITGTGYPVHLQANEEGTTTLRATATSGSDSLSLTVLRPDGARVWIPTGTPLIGPGDSFFGEGYALRPGASVSVAAEPRAGSTALLGFDLLDWNIDPVLFSNDSAGATVNTRRIKALGTSGVATISTQLGGQVEVAALSASEVPTLKVYSFFDLQKGPTEITALGAGDVAAFLLGATDAAGRYVQPSMQDDLDFKATITSGTVVLLAATRSGHGASLRACTGTGTVLLSYLGAERSLPIEVTSATADKACK